MRAAFLITVLVACAGGQYTPGPQVATFVSAIDNTDQPYALYVPRNYDATKKYPVVVSLHDADSNHRLNLRRVFGLANRLSETDVEAARYFPRVHDVDFIVAAPLARGTLGYEGIAEQDVYDVLAEVTRKFHVDENRVYLTGIGSGASGALRLAATRPDVWAAVALVAPESSGVPPERAGNLLNVPLKMFQGALDPLVKPADTRALYRELVKIGVNVEYTEYPNVRHNVWDFAYKDGAIFDWFAKWKRDLQPARVRFATYAYKYRRAYWVTADKLIPGTLATIDARFAAKNRIQVDTTLSGFTLNLKGQRMFSPAQPLTVTVDNAARTVRTAGPVSFSKTASGWIVKRPTFAAGDKQPGSEGPIAAAISARHVYVYGTADSPSNQELLRRKNEAEAAANWSTAKRPLLLALHVLADAELTDKDLASANVVLFGNRDTNSVIAKLAAKLPLRLNPGAADYGLVYVWPTAPGHYALISSGLPWWTRADQAVRPGLPLIPQPHAILNTLPDFLLFKGGLGNVIAEGYFDAHWRLPDALREKVQATGAVELH